jgi:hypothetical protein
MKETMVEREGIDENKKTPKRPRVKMDTSTEKDARHLDAHKHLEAILYQFVHLYERLLEERKVAEKQNAALSQLVDEFAELVAHFESLETQVKSDIQKSIQVEIEKAVVYVGKRLQAETSQAVNLTIETLHKKLNDAVNSFLHHKPHFNFENIKMMMVTLVTSVCISVCLVKWLMPVPVLPLTDDQWKTYETGRKFETLWPTLSKEKQQWFLKTSHEHDDEI